MSVILVYPFKRNMLQGGGAPMGLLYLATYLKKNSFETTVLDVAGEEAMNDDIAYEITRKKPEIIGLPLYSGNLKDTFHFISQLRKYGFSGKIVIGAQHATARPIESLNQFQHADFLIRYEAEIPLTKLADYVINGKGQLNNIENLYYRTSNGIKRTSEVPTTNKDLDILPFPDRNLLKKPFERGIYNRPFVRGDTDFLISSRGCPFNCNFCFPSASIYRARSAENVLEELKYLRSLGRNHIEIMDDTFTVNRKSLEETLRTIANANLNMSFKIRSRVDVIDSELLFLMKTAGVKMIVYGIESGSDRMLREMNKRTSVKDNRRAIELTKMAGIHCFVDFFIGYPGETKESVKKTMKLLLETKPDGINNAVFVPFPMTVGYEVAKKNGRLVGDWSPDMPRSPYYNLDWIERKDLIKLAKRMKRRFYLHPVVLLRTLWFISRNVQLKYIGRILEIAKRLL